MRKWLAGILIMTTFYACKEQSVYEGFSVTNTGLNYKIYSIGEPSQIIHDSDVVELKFYVYSLSDSLIYHSKKTFLYLNLQDSNLNEFLGLLALEDSATVILPAKKLVGFYSGISDSEMLKLSVIPVSVSTYSNWAFYKKYPELANDLEIDEQIKLQEYLRRFYSDSIQYKRGVFIIQQVSGTGSHPKKGDEVEVHYTITNMDRKVLDSTTERDTFFSYVIGEKDQVIDGFDIGIRELRQGGKAIIIVPSKRGFGHSGSSTGIVKSYETLIFDVEIINIRCLYP